MLKLRQALFYTKELKYRLAYTAYGMVLIFIVSYNYKLGIIHAFAPEGIPHFVSTGLTDLFFCYLKLSTNISIAIGFPLFLFQAFLFVKPGLYSYESALCIKFLIKSFFFLFLIFAFVFPFAIETSWGVFSSYSIDSESSRLNLELKLDGYVEHLTLIAVLLTITFPFYLLITVVRYFTTNFIWLRFRGMFYTTVFFFAALLTPPDIWTQVLAGLPAIFFYEFQIFYWYLKKEYDDYLLRQPIKCSKNTQRNKKESQR